MRPEDIALHIGEHCHIGGPGDPWMTLKSEIPEYYIDPSLTVEIVKLTRGGNAFVKTNRGRFLSIPPRNLILEGKQ